MSGTQEFWRGSFGKDYTARNMDQDENNYRFFLHALRRINYFPDSIIEFGAGSGSNIRALQRIFFESRYTALEINESACDILRTIKGLKVINDEIKYVDQFDLVLCKGILIHISPEEIANVYDILHKSTKNYLLVCEYYNPTPVEVEYRGNSGKMWKRDFAGEICDMYKDMHIIDYGFTYHRDIYPQDDITWWLIKRI